MVGDATEVLEHRGAEVPTTTRDKETASCRLTTAEKRAVSLAAAKTGHEFVSRYMRDVLLEDVREQLGEKALEPAENGDEGEGR